MRFQPITENDKKGRSSGKLLCNVKKLPASKIDL